MAKVAPTIKQFRQYGLDLGTPASKFLNDAIQRDIEDAKKFLPGEWDFAQVDELEGLPVWRVPTEQIMERAVARSGPYLILAKDEDDDGSVLALLPEYAPIYRAALMGDKEAQKKWQELNKNVDERVHDIQLKRLLWHGRGEWGTGVADFVLDDKGAIPTFLFADPFARRRELVLSGMSLEQAAELTDITSPFLTGLLGGLSLGLTRLGGPGTLVRRTEAGQELFSTSGERTAETVGSLASWVVPGGAPSKVVSGGRLVGKAAGEAVGRQLTKRLAMELEEKAFKELSTRLAKGVAEKQAAKLAREAAAKTFRARAMRWLGEKAGAVGGMLAYEAFRPHSGAEEVWVKELADNLEAQGMPRAEAQARAEAEFSSQQLKGLAIMIGAVEA
ncbi:MAG: hypothetical protein GXP62_04010, partial [Oligoflexia bacterium]|nr:hypothetical protein [Oligoflexia bacterium]